jgi:hypothetical protein
MLCKQIKMSRDRKYDSHFTECSSFSLFITMQHSLTYLPYPAQEKIFKVNIACLKKIFHRYSYEHSTFDLRRSTQINLVFNCELYKLKGITVEPSNTETIHIYLDPATIKLHRSHVTGGFSSPDFLIYKFFEQL